MDRQLLQMTLTAAVASQDSVEIKKTFWKLFLLNLKLLEHLNYKTEIDFAPIENGADN